MAETVFNFPGFFDREIDLTARTFSPTGVPAGVIGVSERGPAFVPFTLGSFADFVSRYGDLNPKFAAPYVVEKFLANRNALTFMRVLGAGGNSVTADFENTRTKGIVRNAGFKVSGTFDAAGATGSGRHLGTVQFLAARHILTGSEVLGYPMFTDNDSYLSGTSDAVYLVRGAVFTANDARIQVLSLTGSWTVNAEDFATADSTNRYFKLVVSTSQGASFGNSDGFAGVRIYTASLNPGSTNYVGKLLNKDPEKFGDERHVLYADYAVDSEIANVSTGSGHVAILSGSAGTSTTSGDTSLVFREMFGRFDTRYKTPSTTWFISQPFGNIEYDLFKIESLDDGAFANSKYKISIINLIASSNPQYKYGTFTVLVREFTDDDFSPQVVEQFNNVCLDPGATNYIGKVIGDKKAVFNFDVEDVSDRRLVKTGKYPNKSKFVRIIMADAVEKKALPAECLPFGFRGPNFLNTNTILVDTTGSATARLAASASNPLSVDGRLVGAIVPPLPYRFKVTRGSVSTTAAKLLGNPGALEIADSRLYWGVKFERTTDVLNTNIESERNKLIPSLTKFFGIDKLDAVVTGSDSDRFNSNKFTLARVALGNAALTDITTSADLHMKEAAYFRNGALNGSDYTITDTSPTPSVNRITLASILQRASGSDFNKFTGYAKFTTIMYGGFDGVNILDKNAFALNDRATSTEARGSTLGNCNSAFVSPGFGYNQNGTGILNNTVASYRTAASIMLNPFVTNINLLAVPGQRDGLVADYVSDGIDNLNAAMYIMDVPNYDSNANRIWDGETSTTGSVINIEETAAAFEARNIDNSLVAVYFPDIVMEDKTNARTVTVPASVAAMGALGYNDKVAYPWFAPAGFNRAALDFVKRTRTNVSQAERERLYSVRINPVIKFPREGFVILSQKTLDGQRTSLDTISVQRMVLDVQRQVVDVGNRTIWEQLTPAIYSQFVKDVTPILTNVQSRDGLRKFEIVCDSTNNTELDRENNKMNVKIKLYPIKAVEFIAIDFIITREGVVIS